MKSGLSRKFITTMAEFLVQAVYTDARRLEGEVVAVEEDGHIWSIWEKRFFLIVSCPQLTVRQIQIAFQTPGVPQALLDAVKAADAELGTAVLAGDPVTIAQADLNAKEAMNLARPENWPRYSQRLDLTNVPNAIKNALLNIRQARRNCKAAAKAEAKRQVIALIEDALGRSLTDEQKAVDTRVILDKLQEKWDELPRVKKKFYKDRIENLKDAIVEASKIGWQDIESIALDALPLPTILTVTKAQLQAATVIA